MTKVKVGDTTNMFENDKHTLTMNDGVGSVKVESTANAKYATFNVMQSSEISKVLKELTQCVANERDLFIHEQRDLVNSGKQELLWEILPRSDISCSEVSGSTTTNFSLDLGPDIVRSNQSHICTDCGKHFSKRDFLQKHRIVHEEPRHRCVVCEKSFVREDKLKRHFVSIHSKHRPHVCSICAKAFARKDKLKDHQKHHLTAGDSFICLECRIPFVQKSDLNKHTRGSHNGPQIIKDTPVSVSTSLISSAAPPLLTAVLQLKPTVIKSHKPRTKKTPKTPRLSRPCGMTSTVCSASQSTESLLLKTSINNNTAYTSNHQMMSSNFNVVHPQSTPSSVSLFPSTNSLLQHPPSTSFSQHLPSTSFLQHSPSTFSQHPLTSCLSHNLPSSTLSQYPTLSNLSKDYSSTLLNQNPSSYLSQHSQSLSLSQNSASLTSFLQNTPPPIYHNYSYPLDQQAPLISTVFSLPSNNINLQLRSPPSTSHTGGSMLLAAQQHMANNHQQHSSSQPLLRYYPYLPQQRPPFIGHVDSYRQLTTNIYPYMPF